MAISTPPLAKKTVRRGPPCALLPDAKALLKGRQTRATILDAALALASQIGLEGFSIGALADLTGMSKSGVFAHFGSREELQIAVLREYHARFETDVFVPALLAPRGLPRLRALFARWLKRVTVEIDSGCIYISGAVEFDDRPGPVRDALVAMVRMWQHALERAIRAAVAEGHLRSDTDARQLLFEIHGLVLALHHDARFLRHAGAEARAGVAFERLLAQHAARGHFAAASATTKLSTTPSTKASAKAGAKPRAVRRGDARPKTRARASPKTRASAVA